VEVIGLIACYLPIFLNSKLLDFGYEHHAISTTFKSTAVHDSLIFSLSISSLLSLEVWLDLFSNSRRGYLSRCKRILALIIPHIFILTYVIPNDDIRFVPCVISSQFIFYVFAFSTYLIEYGPAVWGHLSVYSTAAVMTVSTIFSCYACFYTNMFTSPVTIYLLFNIAFIYFVIKSCYYYKHVYISTFVRIASSTQSSKSSNSANGKSGKQPKMSHDDYICFVSVTSMIIYALVGIVIPNLYFQQNYTEMSPANFCSYIYTGVLFITLTTMLRKEPRCRCNYRN